MIEVKDYVYAGYPFIGVVTFEEERFIEYLKNTLENYKIYTWDIINGVKNLEGRTYGSVEPVEALEYIEKENSSILIMKDLHNVIKNPIVIRKIKETCKVIKTKGTSIIMLAPDIQVPHDLQKHIVIWEFALPTEQELIELAKKISEDNKIEASYEEGKHGKGLSIDEAENVFALSLVKQKDYDKKIILEQKMNIIKKSGLLEILEPEKEENLGGFDKLKEYVKRRKIAFTNEDLPAPKGIVLVGPPGTGKTMASKAIASILELPLIRLDIASLKGSLVGESERNMKQALKIIDAVSPAVVQIDEIEKHLAGVQSSARSDSGTTLAMFGLLLTWLQEKTSKTFIVATANDIQELLGISQGALLRRFDEIFFVDFPNEKERAQIIEIMNKKYKSKVPVEYAAKTENWSGAELEKLALNSIYDGVENAYANIRPLYWKNKINIDKLREWAKENCIPVSETKETAYKRKITSNN